MALPAIGAAPSAPPALRRSPEQAAERAELAELKARDRQVRAHEQAHRAVGGRYAGAPRFDFQRGADGLLYAVAGEVPIDVRPVPGDPQATIAKMDIVRAAALAPVDPSPADLRIAARAARERLDAVREADRGRLLDVRA